MGTTCCLKKLMTINYYYFFFKFNFAGIHNQFRTVSSLQCYESFKFHHTCNKDEFIKLGAGIRGQRYYFKPTQHNY